MKDDKKTTKYSESSAEDSPQTSSENQPAARGKEIGGREGPEPTRYGDWENNGIASDF